VSATCVCKKGKALIKKKLVVFAAATVAVAFIYAGPANAATTVPTVSVLSYGATGNGISDDTPAIQAAINVLEKDGGGILQVPVGTYLLNSYSPSPHPWYFYNLRVGSNITINAAPGAKFLQGPKGRSPLVSGATAVANSVLVFGSANYVVNTFQETSYNGGFYNIKATKANDQSVTLSTSSQVSNFKAGDYVAIYSSTVGDVIPSESTQVTTVSKTGVMGLAHPLARAFATPVIAKVTSLATVNVGVNNLIVQGTEPLNVNEVFGFTASGNTFISDTSVGGSNIYGLIVNDTQGFTFNNNVVTSVGPSFIEVELPQRNSQNVVITSNTFNVIDVGFGEYAAHWTLTGNKFFVYPNATVPAAVFIGGLDVLFSNNYVQGSISSTPLMADWVGVDAYGAYVGDIRIVNNTISCLATALANCLNVAAADTTVTGNQFNATGQTQQAILVQGPIPQTAITITGNTFSAQNAGQVIVMDTWGTDNSVVSCNTIRGAGGMGIYVTSLVSSGTGKYTVAGNSISGFGTAINVATSMLPVTQINSSTTGCAAQ
jgi:hypothetical protein